MSKANELKVFDAILEQVGLPKSSAAKHLGISQAYLSRILSGHLVPSDELHLKIVALGERLKRTGLIAV